MDPVSLAISLFLVLTAVLAGWLGRGHSDRKRREAMEDRQDQLKRDIRRLQGEVRAASTNRNYYRRRLESAQEDLARVTADRDTYRRIAASREITWRGGPPEPQTTPVWAQRRYANHPSQNLDALIADLDPWSEAEIRLTIKVEPQGGWVRRTPEIGPLVWEGPTPRVTEELRCLFTDEDHPFMEPVVTRPGAAAPEASKEWADPDSPALFLVDLEILEPPEELVRVQTIEVVRVETEIEERIIEQPVLIEVPVHPDEGGRVYLSREEVMALFEVELESKLAEFQLRRVPPRVEDLVEDTVPTDETEMSRARRAAIHLKRQRGG